jgi:ubiquinone/menaquinone biosynthesis C-methylase UbiE
MAYEEFAKIYDELINEDIDYDIIVKRIKDVINRYDVKCKDYLDLACGTGNVALKIAENFETTYAVDLSEDMLAKAYDKFQEKGLNISIINQDMTELDLNRTFDLVTCVLDSTNYLIEDGELELYLKSVYSHLKDDGVFLFDINSYYKLSKILGNNIYTHDEDAVFYTWENVFEDDIVNMYLTFFVKKGSLYERFEEEHFERAYREEEIENILKKCGFTFIGKYNGYYDEPVKEDSERILYVVGKNMEVNNNEG